MQKISTVTIEISGMCPAKCPYCAQRRLRQAKHFGGIMPPVLFEQILDHLFEIGIINEIDINPVSLFNWGEPFSNPKINDILQILKKKKLSASISSNFIVKPDIDPGFFPVIDNATFSISGLSQNSYGRIHGASINKVLNNFEDFYKKIREYSPNTKIRIAWHRYTFNENEFWDSLKYFNRPGISFLPVAAWWNDLFEMLDLLDGNLPEDRKKEAERDLFIDGIRKQVAYCKTESKGYRCPEWDSFLVIDEIGQLLLCCGVTRYDSDYVLGNILNMSAEEIWKKKISNPFCNKCLSSGVVKWGYGPSNGGFYEKAWPTGGGLSYLKLWLQYNTPSRQLARILRSLPYGEEMVQLLKKIKRFVAKIR